MQYPSQHITHYLQRRLPSWASTARSVASSTQWMAGMLPPWLMHSGPREVDGLVGTRRQKRGDRWAGGLRIGGSPLPAPLGSAQPGSVGLSAISHSHNLEQWRVLTM